MIPPVAIEFLGVGIPDERDGWLLHRVCVRMEQRQLTAVVSRDPEERRAMLHAAAGRVIPDEGRVWVSGRALSRETAGDVRSRVVEADVRMSVSAARSLTWHVLAGGPLGLARAIFRVPRERRRRDALEALRAVDLHEQATRMAGALDPEGRARLALARALARQPEYLVVRDLDLAVGPDSAARLLALLNRIVRSRQLPILASLASPALACRFADRVIALTEGLLTFDGPPARYAPPELARPAVPAAP